MPSPAVLAQYEQVQQGFAERIMTMAETVTTGDIRTRDIGGVVDRGDEGS